MTNKRERNKKKGLAILKKRKQEIDILRRCQQGAPNPSSRGISKADKTRVADKTREVDDDSDSMAQRGNNKNGVDSGLTEAKGEKK